MMSPHSAGYAALHNSYTWAGPRISATPIGVAQRGFEARVLVRRLAPEARGKARTSSAAEHV